MKILETQKFRKSWEALDPKIKKKYKKQFTLLLKNIFHPSLNTEKLEPKHINIWSFKVDKKNRVLFTFKDSETLFFLDIGPHDIYK